MKIGVYPGSFDPVTLGHMDIINRSTILFDSLIVAVVDNPNKNTLFTIEERVDMLNRLTADMKKVEVKSFSGLLIDFMRNYQSNTIVKGLRAVSDFEYEFQMALMNAKLSPDIETIFLMTNREYSYLSSSMVKEVGFLGGCIDELVPAEIINEIFIKIKSKKREEKQ